jgi:hypothetical protein
MPKGVSRGDRGAPPRAVGRAPERDSPLSPLEHAQAPW